MSKVIIPDIIELEVKNLSKAEKEELLKKLSYENKSKSLQDQFRRRIWVNKNDKTKRKYKLEGYWTPHIEYYDELDDVLINYFDDYVDDFIAFQKSNKNSLYNQALKKHDFKEFDFKEVVENLKPKQKNEVVNEISSVVSFLAFEDKNIEEVEFWEVEPELKEELEIYKNLSSDEKNKYEFSWSYPNLDLKTHLNDFKENKYFLGYLNGRNIYEKVKFFKNEDELILFTLNNQELAPWILRYHEKYLNPHYKINNWIETKYELELVQKDSLDQRQKMEEPKMKM